MRNYEKSLETISMHNVVIKQIHGEKSAQYSYSLFLKAKVLTFMQVATGDNSVEALKIIDQAILNEEDM